MNTILPILQSAAAAHVSDLFLAAGKKPNARIRGVVAPMGTFGPVSAESMDAFRRAVIGERGEAAYAESGAFDAS